MEESIDRGQRKPKSKKQQLKDARMPTTNHLLIIGVDEYKHGFPRLNNAVKDAQAFEKLMIERYGFKEEHVYPLYNEQATADNIIDAFEKLENLTEDDNLIFYFSGHGEIVKSSNRGYWIPFEGRYKKRNSYLNNVEVQDFMATCGARHILGIVDACYSGALLKRGSGSTGTALQRYYTKQSRWLMTSGLLETVSDGYHGKHSPFAAALLSELKYNTSPYLQVDELWVRMRPSLMHNSNATPVYMPLNDVGHLNGEYFFMLANATEIPPVEERSGHSNQIPEAAKSRSAVFHEIPAQDAPISFPASLTETKDHLKKLAISNDLEFFFKGIKDIINKRSRINNDFILQEGRFNQIKRDWSVGLVRDDDYQRTINRIRYAINSMIEDLEPSDLK